MPVRLRPNVDAMQGYVPGEQPPAGARLIKLNTNENPYPPSPAVADAIRAELGGDGARLRLYSDPGADELRRAAANLTGFPIEGILAGNGSDELLSVVMRAFVGEGQAVAYPAPTYLVYETLARAHGAQIEPAAFSPEFALPAALYGNRTQATFVASPNSPSGTGYDAAELARLADSLAGVLVIDEAYADFAGQSALPLARERDDVIVVRTLSKSYSLAGMRVGLAFAHPRIIAGLAKVRDSYSLDRLAIVAGAAALRDPAHQAANTARICATRDRLVEAARRLGLSPLPTQANFAFVRIGGEARARRAHAFLRERDILVRHFSHPALADGLRITVGTDREIDALLAALEAFVQTEPEPGPGQQPEPRGADTP